MTHPAEPSGDDRWGPPTSVRVGHGGNARDSGDWSAPAQERRPSRADRRLERQIENLRPTRDHASRAQGPPAHPTVEASRAPVGLGATAARSAPRDAARERGLPWWAAALVVVVIAAIGGVIDTVGSISVRGGFNIGIVVASVIGILVVRRTHMFPIVIAPPIVYSVGALFQLYLRSSGLHDKKVVFDAAANYLVYGFPAIAAATAAVLIIAGVRMITRK